MDAARVLFQFLMEIWRGRIRCKSTLPTAMGRFTMGQFDLNHPAARHGSGNRWCKQSHRDKCCSSSWIPHLHAPSKSPAPAQHKARGDPMFARNRRHRCSRSLCHKRQLLRPRPPTPRLRDNYKTIILVISRHRHRTVFNRGLSHSRHGIITISAGWTRRVTPDAYLLIGGRRKRKTRRSFLDRRVLQGF
jgi:hypothetical protein